MPENDTLVPEMRASLDRVTQKLSVESKEALVDDYSYAVTSGKDSSKMNSEEKQAIEAYKKHI